MWEPFRLSIEEWAHPPGRLRSEVVPGTTSGSSSISQGAPQCKIVYDKFHILQHANDAIDEVRKAEFFRQGKQKRGLIKGKKWLLMSRWKNLTVVQRGELNRLFQLNRRVFKAYLLKESLEQLWNYRYEGAMLNYRQKWMGPLKWQRLRPFEELADMLLKHLEGILNYCRTKVRFGVIEALNGNIRMLINRGRGYKNVRYLLLKAKRMAVTNAEFVEFQQAKKAA
jgi:transposase